MEAIFLAIQAKLETQALQTIDIDWGQLDEPQDNYPVLFPCALVDIQEIEWEPTGAKVQPGTCSIKVSVGVELLHDTHSGSGTAADALQRMAIIKDVHNALNLLGTKDFRPLIRTKTIYRNLYGIKVATMEYITSVVDISG